jgi:hypothetical protein
MPDTIVGIEQHHEMLRQIGERIDDQLVLGEQHGTGLSDTDDRSDDRHIDIRQIMRLFDFVEPTITGYLRHRRTNHSAL